jgi:IS5 family transposase
LDGLTRHRGCGVRQPVDPDRNRSEPGGAPDATTLLHFRRLLEKHDLTRAIFEAIKGHLAEQVLLLRAGAMMDATTITAPPSTKSRA